MVNVDELMISIITPSGRYFGVAANAAQPTVPIAPLNTRIGANLLGIDAKKLSLKVNLIKMLDVVIIKIERKNAISNTVTP